MTEMVFEAEAGIKKRFVAGEAVCDLLNVTGWSQDCCYILHPVH